MKKVIYIILAALLLAACASKKHIVRTESGQTSTSHVEAGQQTDSTASQQTTTQTFEVQTDSTTETLTFQLTDSGTVKIDADGQISAGGVKSFTKETKRRQNGRKVAKTEDLAHLNYHNKVDLIDDSQNTHWQKADSTDVQPAEAGSGGGWQNWLLNGAATLVLAGLVIAVGWYIFRRIVFIRIKND